MKILQLAPRIPYPLHDGGAIGIFNITQSLVSRGHAVRMVAFTRNGRVPDEMRRLCTVRPVQADTGHSIARMVRSLFSAMPYMVMKYQDKAMFSAVAEEVRQFNPDVIHVDHLAMAPYGLAAKEQFHVPIVLREHNLETTFLRRFSAQARNPFVKAYAGFEAERMRRYEPRTCAAFDGCAMITDHDYQELKSWAPNVHAWSIPAGVIMPPPARGAEEPGNILFLASLDWKPNVDGFLWFVENVWPLLLERFPDATVSVVGKGESPILRKMNVKNMRYVGYVDDVVPYIQKAQVCIVPLFVGSGIRIKILEMMAHGRAIVSTPLGFEGIDAIDGDTLCSAETPAAFTQAIASLLTDAAFRKRMGERATALVRAKYSWDNVAIQFEQLYNEVIASSTATVA